MNTSSQRFCRSCGLNLDAVAQTLAEQRPGDENLELLRKERLLQKFGTIAFGGFGIMVGIGVIAIIAAIVNTMILSGKQPLAGILLVVFVVFAALTLGYVILAETLKDKKKKIAGSLDPQDKEIAAGTRELLGESTFEPIESVTENTTRELYTKAETRKG